MRGYSYHKKRGAYPLRTPTEALVCLYANAKEHAPDGARPLTSFCVWENYQFSVRNVCQKSR